MREAWSGTEICQSSYYNQYFKKNRKQSFWELNCSSHVFKCQKGEKKQKQEKNKSKQTTNTDKQQ